MTATLPEAVTAQVSPQQVVNRFETSLAEGFELTPAQIAAVAADLLARSIKPQVTSLVVRHCPHDRFYTVIVEH